MISTIDGKITSGVGIDILEDYFDVYTKIEDKLECSAWMCGRVTMQMFAEKINSPLQTTNLKIDTQNYFSFKSGSYFMIGVDTKGILRWKDNYIKLSNVTEKLHLIIVVTEKTPKKYLVYLRSKKISYIFAGEEKIDFHKLFNTLKEELHIEKLLIEGGALLNGSVLASDLIDEISLLIAPIVINRSEAPSVFERKGINEIIIKHFSLKNVTQVDKEIVWLRYTKI